MRDIPDAPWVGLCAEDYYDRFNHSMYEDEEDWEDEDDEELYG